MKEIFVKDVKKDDVFFERSFGQWTALEDARHTTSDMGPQHWCRVKDVNGREHQLLQTEGMEHYGPELYVID